MSRERPGAAFYVPAATKATTHHAAVTENGMVGEAVKTQAAKWSDGLNTTAAIIIGEPFTIRVKGIHEFPDTGIAAGNPGDPVWIATADNSLSLASGAGKIPFGRIVEKAGVRSRGVATGRVRIDLDMKDTLS